MSNKFIKLTSQIINLSQIKTIDLSPGKIYINMTSNDFTGFIFYGTGHFWTREPTITICKQAHPEDYLVMDQWINKLNKND